MGRSSRPSEGGGGDEDPRGLHQEAGSAWIFEAFVRRLRPLDPRGLREEATRDWILETFDKRFLDDDPRGLHMEAVGARIPWPSRGGREARDRRASAPRCLSGARA